jgi:D-beta-D-heptose 7-phosphate kinase/D-beta-D-heptose 1-phosphate adenosyltransferase
MLPWVSEVIVFEEDTPYNLIKQIKPHLIVKGGDYTVDTVVGNDLASVHIIDTLEGFSTTKIIEASK